MKQRKGVQMKQKTKNRLITAGAVVLLGASVVGAVLGFKGYKKANETSRKIEVFMAAKDNLEKRDEEKEEKIHNMELTLDSLRTELALVQKQIGKEIKIHDGLEKRIEDTEFETLISLVLGKVEEYNKRSFFEKIFGCGRPKLPETNKEIEKIIESYMLETGKLSDELTAQEIFDFMVAITEKERPS